MTERVQVRLRPSGKLIEAQRGAPLRDILFPFGVEYPCGGKGQCKGCRVKVLSGSLPIQDSERSMLSEREIEEGWRLSCQSRADADLEMELGLWRPDVLVDHTRFEFVPRDGHGVAVDLGTTTLAVQLLDLSSGQVLAVQTALNAQAKHGADIMSRIAFALEGQGARLLRDTARAQIGHLIRVLLRSAFPPESGAGRPLPDKAIREIVVVGNTAMHHLFSGIDISPLASYPFEPIQDGECMFLSADLGWKLPGDPPVRFLPCLGGFVGSDLLAGVLATGLHESEQLVGLIDLGTNGEILLGNKDRILCTSTAAGPAFEGARITRGMRAAPGAIHQVEPRNGALNCHVLGGGPPRGICGSGLVDAVAAALDAGLLLPSGRFADRSDRLVLLDPVALAQCDIRQLQLAKGAIAAGLRILSSRFGVREQDLSRVYLAGAFGNYIDRRSANRIGLLNLPPEKVEPSGNTALLGAKLALFEERGGREVCEQVRSRTEHVSLSADPAFMEIYAEEMGFPAE
ncbi:MAG: DUF4445 domain-containing protein [Candidatus Omnitrophica bacterium]|nr:Na(+)-translocating NADH-quinone reductase subunit F [bacterium]NUN97891.1 DUF4445 domain-containing protein [Candidatus Omnitrophota bacterium]